MKTRIVLSAVILFGMMIQVGYAGWTGMISGIITDQNSQPMPDATVMIESTLFDSVRTFQTGQEGFYWFSECIPGEYVVTVKLDGHSTYIQQGVLVDPGSSLTLNMALTGGSGTQHAVNGKTVCIDTRNATIKTVMKRDFLKRLPNSDSLVYSFSIPGSISGESSVNISGGARVDNSYFFDGIEVTDPVTSLYVLDLNTDAVDAVVIQKAGFKAEYGRQMGGIIEVGTRTPGNEYHGVLRLKYEDEDWRSDYDNPGAVETYDYWKYTGTVEGPILKDKLWFLVSFNYFSRESTKYTIAYYGADYQNYSDLVKLPADRTYQLPMVSLFYQLNAAHRLTFHYSGEDYEYDNYGGDPEYSTPETWMKREQGGATYGLDWTWLVHDRLSFVVQAGVSESYLDYVPQNGDRDSLPFFDRYYYQHYNNADSWDEEDRDRRQISITGDYLVEDLAGNHHFKAGIEKQDLELDMKHVIPGGASYYVDNNPNDPDSWMDAERTLSIFDGSSGESSDYWAVFLQDDWQIRNNLTLNLGLRFEMIEYENGAGNSSVPAWGWGDFRRDSYLNTDGTYKHYTDMEFTNMISPRLGVAWDITKDQVNVLKASIGRYYNVFDLSLVGLFQPWTEDVYATRTQFYIGPEWHDADGNGIPDEDYFYDDGNWQTGFEDTATDWNLLDPDIKPEYTDEFSLSYERQIEEHLVAGIAYTYRKTEDVIEDAGLFVDSDGNIVWTYRGGVKDDLSGLDPGKKYDPRSDGTDYDKHLFYVTNVEDAEREYNGLELNLKGQWKHFDLLASYTLSKSEGSVTDSSGGYTGVAQFSGAYDTYAVSQNLYGELPWSNRHFIKIAGATHWDLTDWYEISLGVNWFYRSGNHYSKRTTPPKTYDPDDPDNIREEPDTWTGRPPYRSYAWYYPEGRGTYDLPGLALMDISLQNTFKFSKWGALTVIFDVENLFDNQGIISENDTYIGQKAHLFGQANDWESPRTWRLSFIYTF
jgi:TonB dependent receptor-like, beta-barrel/Carboxypeptidase regulatory-like domain